MFDLLMDRRRRGPAGIFDTLKMRIFKDAVDAAIVWGLADVDIYARETRLPTDKFIFHPFHITLEGYEFEIRDDGYIFAGGNHGRDFETLIDALKEVDYPAFIATQVPGVAERARPYPHITVRGVSPRDFRQLMAGSTLVVEAHPPSFFRTAGHQTFLNAMWMGKPFVLADRRSSYGYFTDGIHWLVTDAGDAGSLRQLVRRVLADPALAHELGRAARALVQQPQYRTLNCMQDIYNIAIRIEARRHGIDPGSARIQEY